MERCLDVRRRCAAIALLFVTSATAWAGQDELAQAEGLPWPNLRLDSTDRVLVLAPHPDDEVLGCGGVIQQAVAMRLPLRIVFLTYGDFYERSFLRYERRPVLTPRGVQGMGEIRHGEALAADATLGAPAADLVFLGYPDFGTMKMWHWAWDGARPVRGMLSRATAVPYPDAFRPGAPYKGDEVLKDLTTILREFRPTKVFVSHPADHHPDHKAFYLFARVALLDLAPEVAPRVYPYLVHYTKWPVPFGRHPEELLTPPAFLKDRIPWEVVALDGRQVRLKGDALKKHKTQYETTPGFLDSFVRRNELFGDFPPIELSGQAVPPPPHVSRESEGLTPVVHEEQAYLVGSVTWTAQIESETLVFSIRLSRPLAREVGCSVYLFGYRKGTPFPALPKLHLALGELTHRVFDGDREVASREVQVQRGGRDIRIRVPLPLLRRPQKIFVTAQMHEGPVPLDWTSWRILETAGAAAQDDGSLTRLGSGARLSEPVAGLLWTGPGLPIVRGVRRGSHVRVGSDLVLIRPGCRPRLPAGPRIGVHVAARQLQVHLGHRRHDHDEHDDGQGRHGQQGEHGQHRIEEVPFHNGPRIDGVRPRCI